MESRKISAWVTIKHHHIPIFEGESKQDVINRLKMGAKKGKETYPVPKKSYIKKRDAAEKAVNALQSHIERVAKADERLTSDKSESAKKEKLNADRTLKEAEQRYKARKEEFKKIEKHPQMTSYKFTKKQMDKELQDKNESITRNQQVAQTLNNPPKKYDDYDKKIGDTLIVQGPDGKYHIEKYKGQDLDTYSHYGQLNHDQLVAWKTNKGIYYENAMKDISYNDIYGYLQKEYNFDAQGKTLKTDVAPMPKEPEYERTPKMDWIDKRIEGKNKEIEKLEKKLERINKAKESDYKENNPYYYSDYDFRSTTKDLENAKKDLEKYKQDMETEISKAKSRNVPVITEFLNDWEQKSIEYFSEQHKIYKEQALPKYREQERQMVDWLNYPSKYVEGWDRNNEEHKKLYREKNKEHSEFSKIFKTTWKPITQFYDGSGTWDENMRRAVAKEKSAKYDDIITRTNDLIGQITDAGGLHIGKKGDLNGLIVGTKGRATVETIGAGGYNIQRYHFRTLINKLKEKEPEKSQSQLKTKEDNLIPYDKWESKPSKQETFYDNGSKIPRTVYEYDENRYEYAPDVRKASKASTLKEVEAWRNDDGTYGQGEGDESIFVIYDDGRLLDLTDGEPHKRWSKENIKGISVSTGDYMQVWGEEYDKKNKQWIPLETTEMDENSNDIPGYSNSYSGRQAIGSYKVRMRQTTTYNEKYGRWNNKYEVIARSTINKFKK